MSLNVCTFSGRLGRDAEQKQLSSGTSVMDFSIAVDTGFGDKKRSFWIKCSMFGDRATKLATYLTKGQLVGVSGELTQSDDGKFLNMRVNAVELIGGKRDDAQAASHSAPARSAPAAKAPAFDEDDDIPF